MSSVLSVAGISAAAQRIEALVGLVAQDPGLTSHEVAERLDLSRRHASLLLLRLEERGAVVHEGRSWFPAPPRIPSAP